MYMHIYVYVRICVCVCNPTSVFPGAPVVGVVVKVEHSGFKVLTTHNTVETVDVGAMGRKRSSRNTVALDCQEGRIEVGTPVADLSTGAEGTVKHIFKSFLFLHTTDTRVNSGISCVRARQVCIYIPIHVCT